MPSIPSCLVADLRVKTVFGLYRSRFYYTSTRNLEDEHDVEACCNALYLVIPPLLSILMSERCIIEAIEGRWHGPGAEDIEGNSTLPQTPGQQSATLPGAVDDTGDDISGIGNIDTLPDDVVLMIQLRTGQAGRPKRGRRFFSGMSEVIQNDGRIVNAHRAACTNLANSLNVDVATVGLPTAGGTTDLHARHWDRKNNLLHPITKTYVMGCMMSRMNRRPRSLLNKF